jgi:hypothetical protein
MGAPGEIYLCEKGHEVFYTESRMRMDYYEAMQSVIDVVKRSPCPVCHSKVKYIFGHYDGSITDCSDVKLIEGDEFHWLPTQLITVYRRIGHWNFDISTVPEANIIKE